MRNVVLFVGFAGVLLLAQNQPRWPVLQDVPPAARQKTNPLANDPDSPIAGRKLFEQHCTACHGKTAEGSRRAPALFNDEMRRATQGDIFWILTNGVVRHGMPSWSHLPEPQRWQLVAYIISMNAK